MADQLGLNEGTVYNWEKGRTEPVIRLLPRIYQFLGYAPLPAC